MGLKYVVKGVSVLKDLTDLENIIVGFKQVAATPTAPGQNTAGSHGCTKGSCLSERCRFN